MNIYEQLEDATKEYEKILSECSNLLTETYVSDEEYQTRLNEAWMKVQQASYDVACHEHDMDVEM